MTLIIIVLLIIIVASFFSPFFEGKTASYIRLGLCALLIILSAIRYSSTRIIPPPQKAMDRHSLVGWQLGKAIAKDFPDGGSVVVLQMFASHKGLTELNTSQIQGLQKGAGSAFEFIPHGQEKSENPLALTQETLNSLDKSAQRSIALVSFLPLPIHAIEQDRFPPLYLFDAMGSKYWKQGMQDGIVYAVVHPATGPNRAAQSKKSDPPEKRFKTNYQLSTP